MSRWKTKDGCEIEVKDMADSHLLNTIKMLERATDYYNWTEGLEMIRVSSFLGGEMAQEAAAEEADRIFDQTPDERYPIYTEMMAEASKRNLFVKRWCVRCQQFHEEDQKACIEKPCDECGKSHPVPVNEFHRAALHRPKKEK